MGRGRRGGIQEASVSLEAQFAAGLQSFDEAFHLVEAKDPEDIRVKTIQLCQKTLDCLRQVYEVQARDFQTAVAKWTELLVTKAAA